MKCRGCRNEIPESEPLFVLVSLTLFEICDGDRLPFHLPHCSDECRLASARRENETLAGILPAMVTTVEQARQKYPGAFQKKRVANFWRK